MPLQVRAGSFVWVQRDKVRVGVVLEVRPDGKLIVATGTGQEHPHLPSVALDPGTRRAGRSGISKRTYFHARGIAVVDPSAIKSACGPCPPSLFLEIDKTLRSAPPVTSALTARTSTPPVCAAPASIPPTNVVPTTTATLSAPPAGVSPSVPPPPPSAIPPGSTVESE